ncbi:MAG: Fur family transcriptional regulator [Desulfomonilia bacterium]
MQQEYLKPICKNCSPNGYCVDKFISIVKSGGGRLTKERLSLLGTICDIEGHFNPYHLLDLLKAQGYNLSLTTVYRNLALLVQAGIIRRSCIQEEAHTGGAWYEHIWDHEHHDHLICSSCSRKVEFTYPAIEILQEAVAKEYGFTLESHHLELIGLCAECRNKRDGGEA